MRSKVLGGAATTLAEKKTATVALRTRMVLEKNILTLMYKKALVFVGYYILGFLSIETIFL